MLWKMTATIFLQLEGQSYKEDWVIATLSLQTADANFAVSNQDSELHLPFLWTKDCTFHKPGQLGWATSS